MEQVAKLKRIQSFKLFQRFLKIIALTYIYQLAKFGDLMGCGSKNIFKNAPCLMYSALKITDGQQSIAIATAFATAEKFC